MQGTVNITERACYKVQELGKQHTEAYLFTKVLASIAGYHPIIKNIKANLTAIRLLTPYTDKQYRQLLKLAITYGYAAMKGNHLRLYSHTQEKRDFKIRRRHQNREIKICDLNSFYQIAVLKHNTEKQKYIINKKASTINTSSGACEVNYDVILSTRKIAELLFVSQSYAVLLAKKLHTFGLRLTTNRQQIHRDEFYKHRYWGSPFGYKYRYDISTAQFYKVEANTVKFDWYAWEG